MGKFFKKKLKKIKHDVTDDCPKDMQLYKSYECVMLANKYICDELFKMHEDPSYGKRFPYFEKCIPIFRAILKYTSKMKYWSALSFAELILRYAEHLKYLMQKSTIEILRETGQSDIADKYDIRPPVDGPPTYTAPHPRRERTDNHYGNQNSSERVAVKSEPNRPKSPDNFPRVDEKNRVVYMDDVNWFYKGPLVLQFTSDGSVFMNRQLAEVFYEELVFHFNIHPDDLEDCHHRQIVSMYVGRDWGDGYVYLRTYLPGVPQRPFDFAIHRDSERNITHAEIVDYHDAIMLREYLEIGLKDSVKYCFKLLFDERLITLCMGFEYDEDSPTPWKNDKAMEQFLPRRHMRMFF